MPVNNRSGFLSHLADKTGMTNAISYIWAWRSLIIAIGVPVALLPLCFAFSYDPELEKSMQCAYCILVMVILWTTETLPLAVTSLLPMILYPMLQIVPATDLAPKYMSESNIAFLGSIIVIGAFERVGLHKRFALRVLTIVGAKPRWLVAGFMVVSWFLSMWTSNTMTTILLTPIVISVTHELRTAMNVAMHQQGITVEKKDAYKLATLSRSNLDLSESAPPEYDQPKSRRDSKSSKTREEYEESDDDEVSEQMESDHLQNKYENMLLLSIAYSASIGGTGTVIGTGPNLIMKEQLEQTFAEKGCTSPLNFLSWMIFAIPMSFMFLCIMWLWLLFFYTGIGYTFGCKNSPLDRHRDKVEMTIKRIYDQLPPMDFVQVVVLGHSLVMIVLLVTRQISTEPLIGWELIAPGYVKESTATFLAAVSLFIFPITLPYRDTQTKKLQSPGNIVKWSEIEREFPFGVLLLIGGGMAAAYGAEVSGLASLLASLLSSIIENLDDALSLFIILIFMVFVTEFMSNTACVTLMMPILSELADIRNSNPMLFMYPTALAASFAFMFPVATPPNAIIFQTGKFRIIDMITAGFVVNFVGIGVVMFATMTYGGAYFQLFEMPWEVANMTNTTDSSTPLVVYTCL